MIALSKPAPDTKAPVQPPVPAPAEKPAPAFAGDLSAYIEAQRRARAGPAPVPSVAPTHTLPEDAESRRNRIIAGNLGSQRDQAFSYDPTRGGGMFQITRLTSDYAEFIFYGWNRDVNRNTKQVIEVSKGNNSDIRLAVVRKMIAIIREDKNDEFLWESQRLGRSVMLSARLADNAGLEDFMLRDFFSARPTRLQALFYWRERVIRLFQHSSPACQPAYIPWRYQTWLPLIPSPRRSSMH